MNIKWTKIKARQIKFSFSDQFDFNGVCKKFGSGSKWAVIGVKTYVDGLVSKWTVLGGRTGQSKRLNLEGDESNWKVKKTLSGRSEKVGSPEIQKWTVQGEKTVRYKEMNLGDLEKVGQKGSRSKRINLNGLQKCKWTVQKQKLDGLKEWN